MVPMFSWPMITGAFVGGVLYSLTSVPQIPATSIFNSALSSGISGIGYSRNSVLLGPVLTAASTFSTQSSDNDAKFLMLAPSKNRLDAATQVKRWTRRRFGLTSEATL